MRLKKLKLKNFRNTPDLDLDLNGGNICFYGDNMVGKSNSITAVHALLNAKFPPGSIKHGAEDCEVEAILADFKRGDDVDTWVPIEGTEHRMRAHIYINKKGAQQVDIELHYPNGGADDTVTPIRSYIGEVPLQLNFVALSATAEGRKKQMEIVRGMFPPEIQEELRKIENRIRLQEKERTDVGRDLDNAKAFAKKSIMLPAEQEKYVKKIDVVEVSKQQQEAIKHNDKHADVVKRKQERTLQLAKLDSIINNIKGDLVKFLDRFTSTVQLPELLPPMEASFIELKPEFEKRMKELILAKLQVERDDLDSKNLNASKWLEENPVKDLTAFDTQLKTASDHNSMVDKVILYKKAVKDEAELSVRYGELDALVNASREMFKATVRSFDFPVPGMSFDDEQVLYNGKPCDIPNTSTAEKMVIDAMLQIQKCERAHVLFMENGQNLGTGFYNELKELCDANGIQWFLEQVERQDVDKKALRVVIENGGQNED